MTEPGANDKTHPPQGPVDPTHAFQAPPTTPGFVPADTAVEPVTDPFGESPRPGDAAAGADTQAAPPPSDGAEATLEDSVATASFAARPPLTDFTTPPPPPPPPYVGPAYPYGLQPKELYPIRLEIEYRERLSRIKTLFRGFLILPLLLFGYIIWATVYNLVFAARIAIFFRRKYPDWMFSFATGHLAWQMRFSAHWLLLTDAYPSFSDEGGAVKLEVDAPVQGRVSRWRGLLWRAFLIIPQTVVLYFLWLAVFVVTLMAWFAILFTGRYPRGLFGFVVGVQRWTVRSAGYGLMLTDRYPPYALSASAGPASNKTVVWSGLIGAVGGALYAVIIIAVVVAANNRDVPERQVDYAKLSQGSGAISLSFSESGGPVTVRLVRAYDPGNDQIRAINPTKSERVVVFEWEIRNNSSDDKDIQRGMASLTTNEGGKNRDHSPDVVIVEDRSAPAAIRNHGVATVRAVFVIPVDAKPVTLDFNGGRTGAGAIGEIRYRFAQ